MARRVLLWWACGAAAIGLAACDPPPRSPLPTDGEGARIEHLAAASFVVTLLDDAVPPRWRDPGAALRCDAPARVWIDGAPLRAGDAVPAISFSLRWQLHGCEVVGAGGARYTGEVRLEAFHEDDGAIGVAVQAEALHAGGSGAPRWPTGGFAARSPLTHEGNELAE